MKRLYFSSRNTLFACVAAMALSVCMGCSSPEPSTAAPATPQQSVETPEAKAVAPVAAGPASVSGRVTYSGERPERLVINTAVDADCAAMHEETPLLDDRVVVSAEGGVMWAFVYIKDRPEGEDYPPSEEMVLLDQVGCRYTPHLIGVQVGQEFGIRNSDKLLHNSRGLTRINRPFNFGQPFPGTRKRVFKERELRIKVECDIHAWMGAYIFAVDHPLFSVSDGNGAFDIPNVPEGEHTLVIWHETFGEIEKQLNVGATGALELEITFDPAPEE